MRTRQKQRIIIGTLCAIIIGLTVGYAVLSQTLNIQGTGSIASDFNILFTDIQEGTMNDATTVNKQITDSTTAVFTIDLSKPGASGEYNITVENRGTIDAYVDSINGIDEANQTEPTDITFSIEGLKLYDSLPSKQEKTFKVKVNWDSSSTSIPNSDKTLTLSINFVQDSGNRPTPTLGNAAEYLIKNKLSTDITSSGMSGLYAIDNTSELTTSASPREYRYIGSNPDNYIQFNNELWRIIGIFDGQLKIIRANSLEDSRGWGANNNWSNSNYLSGEYYNSIDSNDQNKIDDYTWKLGGIPTDISGIDTTVKESYNLERGTTVYNGNPTEWTGKIALIYPSDYGLATSGGSTTNRSSCISLTWIKWYNKDCYNNSWIYGYLGKRIHLTTLTHSLSDAYNVIAIIDAGIAVSAGVGSQVIVVPALYLTPEVELSTGTGTIDDPYILK